jgi:hypothetical protein
MTPSIPIFHNENNALGDFRSGVKVAGGFAVSTINVSVPYVRIRCASVTAIFGLQAILNAKSPATRRSD